jgi:hypothetical protein
LATIYPNGIDNNSSLPQAVDLITPVKAEAVNQLRSAIIAIESEMGIDPSREYATVRARLDAMEAGGSGSGNINVYQNSIPVVLTAERLNFVGNGVLVESRPNYEARIEINTNSVQTQESFTATAGQTSFILTNTPLDSTTVFMFLNGSKQVYNIDYTVSGTTVSYISADYTIQLNDSVEFWYVIDGGFTTGSGGDGYITITDDNTSAIYYDITGIHFYGLTVSDNLDGTVQVVGGKEALKETLSYGNITDGYDIIVSSGDYISGATNVSLLLLGGNSTTTTAGSVNITGGTSTSGTGGNIVLTGGSGTTNATNGSFTFTGGTTTGTGYPATGGGFTVNCGASRSGGPISIVAGRSTTTDGADCNIRAGQSTAAAGGAASFSGGAGATNGGGASLIGGDAGNGTGGGATLYGGLGITGGVVSINAGGNHASTTGGAANVSGGAASTTTGTGGKITINGGGAATGGDVIIFGGSATSGTGGDITIYSGTAAAGNSGNVSIQSSSSTVSGQAGSVEISVGESNGSYSGSDLILIAGTAGNTGAKGGGIIISAADNSDIGDGGDITINGGNSSAAIGGNINLNPGTGVSDGYVLLNGQMFGFSSFVNIDTETLIDIDDITTTEYIILVDTSSVNWLNGSQIILPSSGIITGTIIIVKDSGGLAASKMIVINGNGINIDGSSVNISANYGFQKMIFNGTEWFVISG